MNEMYDSVKTRYLLDKIALEQAKKMRTEDLITPQEYHTYLMRYRSSKKAWEFEKAKKKREWG